MKSSLVHLDLSPETKKRIAVCSLIVSSICTAIAWWVLVQSPNEQSVLYWFIWVLAIFSHLILELIELGGSPSVEVAVLLEVAGLSGVLAWAVLTHLALRMHARRASPKGVPTQ